MPLNKATEEILQYDEDWMANDSVKDSTKPLQSQIDKIAQILREYDEQEIDPNYKIDDEFLNLNDAAGPYLFTSASIKDFYDWFHSEDYEQGNKELMMKNILGTDDFEEVKKMTPQEILTKYYEAGQDDIYEFWRTNTLEHIKDECQYLDPDAYEKIVKVIDNKEVQDEDPNDTVDRVLNKEHGVDLIKDKE